MRLVAAAVFAMLAASAVVQPASAQIFIDLDGPRAPEVMREIFAELESADKHKNCPAWRRALARLEEFIAVRKGVGDEQVLAAALRGKALLPRGPCISGSVKFEYEKVCETGAVPFYYIPLPPLPGQRPIIVIPEPSSAPTPAPAPVRAPACIQISAATSFSSVYTGDKSGFGTIASGGDPFIAKTDERTEGAALSASYDYAAGDWRQSFGLDYSFTSSESSGEVASGTSAGYIPQEVSSDPGWASGLGVVASSDTERYEFSGTYRIAREFNWDGGGSWGAPVDAAMRNSRKDVGIVLRVRGSELTQEGHVESVAVPGIGYADIDQKLKSYEFGIGPSVSGIHALGRGFYVGGGLDLLAVARYSELSSEESCGSCGGAPSVSTLEDDMTKLSVAARLRLVFGYTVAERVNVGLTGGVDWSGRDIIDIRRNPADEDTHIDTQSGVDWNTGLRVHVSF